MIKADCQKYTIIFDDKSRLYALRNGEPWRDLVGDGMVLAMLQKIDDQNEAIEAAKDLLLSSIIATPEGRVELCAEAFSTLDSEGTK